MLMATVNQGYVFLCTVGAGVAMGVLYDGVRILRRTLHLGRVLTFLLDLVYWAVVLAVALFAVLYANEGEVRPFTILGFALGCALYLIGFSPIVLGIWQGVMAVARKIAGFGPIAAIRKIFSK